jgi:hypothetical protein
MVGAPRDVSFKSVFPQTREFRVVDRSCLFQTLELLYLIGRPTSGGAGSDPDVTAQWNGQ